MVNFHSKYKVTRDGGYNPIRINLKILIHHEDTKFTKKNQRKIFVFFVSSW